MSVYFHLFRQSETVIIVEIDHHDAYGKTNYNSILSFIHFYIHDGLLQSTVTLIAVPYGGSKRIREFKYTFHWRFNHFMYALHADRLKMTSLKYFETFVFVFNSFLLLNKQNAHTKRPAREKSIWYRTHSLCLYSFDVNAFQQNFYALKWFNGSLIELCCMSTLPHAV